MGCEVKDIVDACRYAVSGIVCLQNEANKVHNDEILFQVTNNGLRLLSKVILKWIRIPFQAPKYFFRVRSLLQNMEQRPSTCLAWESTDVVEMNGRLFQYVTECSKKTNYGKRSRDNDIDKDGKLVTAFADFELNERGQGFSNSLLDVSKFPVGTYRIKWHSCCIILIVRVLVGVSSP